MNASDRLTQALSRRYRFVAALMRSREHHPLKLVQPATRATSHRAMRRWYLAGSHTGHSNDAGFPVIMSRPPPQRGHTYGADRGSPPSHGANTGVSVLLATRGSAPASRATSSSSKKLGK